MRQAKSIVHGMWKPALSILGVAAVAGAAFLSGRSWAGVPTTEALSYSGMLTDGAGAPLTGSHNVQVLIHRVAAGGTPFCQTVSTPVELKGGRFSVPLPDTCDESFAKYPNTWVEVLVDGASLGRTKIGAVPYALDAARAEAATGALAERTDLKSLVTLNTMPFADVRRNSPPAVLNEYVEVPNRRVTFTKRFADSRLKITYQDTLGSRATGYAACRWRILLGTTEVASFSEGDLGDGAAAIHGWRMNNGAHVAWVPTAAAGSHTVSVHWAVTKAFTPDTECLAGWNATGGFLSVEEIP